MSRKIVLLSDGTGNSSAKVWRTNVWRVFESLDLSGPEQVAFYDDGVGTAAFKPIAILGGAFGYGLERNVIDIYKFASRNYRDANDEIYGFGFSRGAFTMRIVTGLILEQGLVQAKSEAELDANAKAAYRAFRINNFHTKWPRLCRPEEWARWVSGLFSRTKYTDADNRKNVKIRFLGLYDTVAAYGMPVEEMARGISQWIWPWMLLNCSLDTRVERACHALSIDDERTTFHPVLWDERKVDPLLPDEDGKRYLAKEHVSQVWFAGVHSNVGGGYPDDSVAQIPLVWMLSEARSCGPLFKSIPDANPQTYGHPNTAQDRDGRIYDSRQGLGGYYRYGPRDIGALGKELLSRRGAEALPRIHESVFRRIQTHAQSYGPMGLPARYEVVTTDGQVLAAEQNPYEPGGQAIARWHGQERVWNIVWLRRIVYFLTVGVSAYLFAFPLMKAAPAEDELTTWLRWVSDIVRTFQSFLPAAARPWMDGYAREPAKFIAVALLLAAMLKWGSWLAGKIQSRMGILWQASLGSRLVDEGIPTNLVYRFRKHPHYLCIHQTLKTTIAPGLFALLFVYLGLTFVSHVLFNIQDDLGLVCKKTEAPKTLAPGEILLANGATPKLEKLEEEAKNNLGISDSDKKNPFKYPIELPTFQTSELCKSMGVMLERHGKYLIRFEGTETFSDWNGTIYATFWYYSFGIIKEPPRPQIGNSMETITDYFSFIRDHLRDYWLSLTNQMPERQRGDEASSAESSDMSLPKQLGMMALIPLRRDLTQPWFRVVARIGPAGGEESFLRPDFSEDHYKINETVQATRNGELFLFVNDAVIGIPGLYHLFYGNNRGSTRVLIMRK